MDKLKEKLEEIACAWDGCTVDALDGESKIDVGAWLRKMFADIQSQAQPDEPTEAMIEAGCIAIRENGGEGTADILAMDAVEAYHAMLDAAPIADTEREE